MSLVVVCPLCKKMVDNVCFERDHLGERTIPVWHPADGEDHHWALDEQSSEKLRKNFKDDETK